MEKYPEKRESMGALVNLTCFILAQDQINKYFLLFNRIVIKLKTEI